MKTKFYRNYVLWFYVTFLSILYLAGYSFNLYGLSLSSLQNNTKTSVIIVGLLPFVILSLMMIVFKNEFFSKMIIHENGIETYVTKKKSTFIKWDEIKHIDSYFSFSRYKYIHIIYKDVSLDFNANTAIVKTLLLYIKDETLNQQLKKIQTHKYRMATRGIGFNR